jgi:hypothetical protein
MTPLPPPPPHQRCAAVVTRVGRLESCALTELRLRTRDGRTIRFGRVGPLVVWESFALSPNRRWLLLDASVVCDTHGAYVVRVTGGTPLPVPKPTPGCEAADDEALGWTRDDRARVRFTPYDCACSLRAGVYAVDPATRTIRSPRRLA